MKNIEILTGTALMQLVEVHKEIHAQQTNIVSLFRTQLNIYSFN